MKSYISYLNKIEMDTKKQNSVFKEIKFNFLNHSKFFVKVRKFNTIEKSVN